MWECGGLHVLVCVLNAAINVICVCVLSPEPRNIDFPSMCVSMHLTECISSQTDVCNYVICVRAVTLW